ncbi:calcium-binding protein PBP1-like [Coffea eugenioides]|nr:calcium-binding protein PBP1-like [Coffea arabica]XP_027170953.1 calcium-binding protein PBP1-like [Coffea eugenioides]
MQKNKNPSEPTTSTCSCSIKYPLPSQKKLVQGIVFFKPNDKSMSIMDVDELYDFEDYFPSMIQRLGSEGFMGELCSGFYLLMDVTKGLITFESLKKNTLVLGLHDLGDDEIVCMLAEGDMDGDGALNQMEFCILMFRLSPGLMDGSKRWMEEMGVNDM